MASDIPNAIALTNRKDLKQAFTNIKIDMTYRALYDLLHQYDADFEQREALFVLPKSPLRDMDADNALVLTKAQRGYLCQLWRVDQDLAAYERAVCLFAPSLAIAKC